MANLTPQVTQIEVLSLDFLENFEIGAETCQALRLLTKLKKVKFQLSLIKFQRNLQILESLKGVELQELNLKVILKRYEGDIPLISSFLETQKDLRVLKIKLSYLGKSGDLDHMK